jgi:subtilisin-like proprotein convertase family protein
MLHSNRLGNAALAAFVLISGIALSTPAVHAQTTFSNTALITLSDDPTTFNDGTVGTANPYPSTINVSGLTGVISQLTVSLNGLTHTFTRDLDILLVGPGGQSVLFLSDAGTNGAVTNLNLTFSDTASGIFPTDIFSSASNTSGTYLPTNTTISSENPDIFPAPAPSGPYGGAFSAFNGANPNGTYSLYIVDDGAGDTGTISNGWSVTITTTGVSAVAPEPATGLLGLCGLAVFGAMRRRKQ